MGLLKTLLVLAAIFIVVFWAYNNVKINSVNLCIKPERVDLDITCVDFNDCTKYLTSVYGTFPNTFESQFILSQTTACNLGKCSMNKYEYKDVCAEGEVPLTYKITLKDYLMR